MLGLCRYSSRVVAAKVEVKKFDQYRSNWINALPLVTSSKTFQAKFSMTSQTAREAHTQPDCEDTQPDGGRIQSQSLITQAAGMASAYSSMDLGPSYEVSQVVFKSCKGTSRSSGSTRNIDSGSYNSHSGLWSLCMGRGIIAFSSSFIHSPEANNRHIES